MTHGMNYREEANAIVAWAFRNGLLEGLHAGERSTLLDDPELSRITDGEMKRLMLQSCEVMENILKMRDTAPEEYAKSMEYVSETTKSWDK